MRKSTNARSATAKILRSERELLSDHVLGYVNSVTKEIAKSNPQAKVLGSV